jgi:hypothetical protein
VNLKAFGEEVLEYLLEPLRVGDDGAAKIGIDLHFERELPVLGLVAEGPPHRIEQAADHHTSSATTVTVPDSIFERSRCR